MWKSGLAAAAALLAVAFGAGAAQAAPTSGLAQAPVAPAAQSGQVEEVRWRGNRRHRGGFSLRIGPGIGFYAGRGYPYYGYRNYYRPYGYRSYGYTNRRCWWSSRLNRQVCRR